MNREMIVAERRVRMLHRMFPEGIPALWCPALTHYDERGEIDEARMAAHLRHLSGYVKGFLIPGSTGDGWELKAEETRQLLEIALRYAQAFDLTLLIGALHRGAGEALEFIQRTAGELRLRGGAPDVKPVCGFTVCPPCGSELSQSQIGRALGSIFATGYPIALYQLPQVTQNEIKVELACDLAGQYENFLMFKDSSGTDQVVAQAARLGGVVTFRGAEGDYARWCKAGGGPYDGFLLSTANCFAPQLCQMIGELEAGRVDAAREISNSLTVAVNQVFELVNGLPFGNKFTNANKAMDHFLAWGKGASTAPRPRLHGGGCLPLDVMQRTEEILARQGLLPEAGYL
ncbi:MAG: dihydrodipicolinate synthase family protein [Verrucomicrobiota bacterium]|jgi:dihydrodipicolinate synthase/N-acetylneuraminate lyase